MTQLKRTITIAGKNELLELLGRATGTCRLERHPYWLCSYTVPTCCLPMCPCALWVNWPLFVGGELWLADNSRVNQLTVVKQLNKQICPYMRDGTNISPALRG